VLLNDGEKPPRAWTRVFFGERSRADASVSQGAEI